MKIASRGLDDIARACISTSTLQNITICCVAELVTLTDKTQQYISERHNRTVEKPPAEMRPANNKISDSYYVRTHASKFAPNRLMRNVLLAGFLCMLMITLRMQLNSLFGIGTDYAVVEWFSPSGIGGLLDWRPKETVVALNIPLRILPLGDSITEGFRSSDGNGYRLHLQNLLAANGYRVNYIGSIRSGNMTNNKHDGFGGKSINGISSGTRNTLAEQPNVVLLHAGTNDMNDDPPREPYDTAPDRLGDLIDEILDAVPQTTIIAAQIVQSAFTKTRDRISTYNAVLPDIVAKRSDKGAKVLMVDMSSIGAHGVNIVDRLHPNDTGYEIMAEFWFRGLQTASDEHWITEPR